MILRHHAATREQTRRSNVTGSIMQARERKVEQLVRDVYNYCPPTETHYHGDGRRQYERVWGSFLESIGVPPAAFRSRRVLDVGCGSCEKAAFYADWGGRVTGLEMTPEV